MMIEYETRKSSRAKSLRITVRQDKSILVTIPKGMNEGVARSYVASKLPWIDRALAKISKRTGTALQIPKASAEHYAKHKTASLCMIKGKLEQFAPHYGIGWKKIFIRNQSTRWGSCSKAGNLNFNYRLLFLPVELADYVIVHELCHLLEFNHSRRFWELVGQTVPDFKNKRKMLKDVR